ncbi:serine/threonine protein kinase [Basidiobolus ranarum]|uniref:Serine/threonine protein kinase n=1 Tax=Basidiobolus ranarum TaxID=34480 RepID=A0ABR2WA26_9FUNG
MLLSGNSDIIQDKNLFDGNAYFVSPNKDSHIPYSSLKTPLNFNASISYALSAFSTLTSSESGKDSNVSEVDITSLSQISSRFVFSAIQNHKGKAKKDKRFSCDLKNKSRKEDVYQDLPLLIALKNRNAPSLQELYGSFSEILGSGSGGKVHSTYSIDTGKKYAVKKFRSIRGSESRRHYYENISNEIYIGASLDHPNIIRTIDVAMEDGQIHQVMEFCSMDLVSLFKGVQISQSQINQYFVQMMTSLRYLHRRGVAHRDLKLENFCLGEDGLLKLIDFGCAFIFNDSLNRNTHKLATSITGTDPYIAPEVHEGSAYDAAKADVWSAAIVLICMVLRKFPWEQARMTDKGYANYLKYRHEDRFFRNIPSDSLPLLRSMLNPNPCRRPTVEEVFMDPWFQSLLNIQ